MTFICFSGHIGSGKSTLSNAVSTALEIERVSFGDAVRAEASVRSLPVTRKSLQDLGDQLIAEGWDKFIARVLAQSEWNGNTHLVIDGVRHLEAISGLRRASQTEPYVIFVDTPIEQRIARLIEGGSRPEEAEEAAVHRNEAEVELVREAASAVVANDGPVESAVSDALAALARTGILRPPR